MTGTEAAATATASSSLAANRRASPGPLLGLDAASTASSISAAGSQTAARATAGNDGFEIAAERVLKSGSSASSASTFGEHAGLAAAARRVDRLLRTSSSSTCGGQLRCWAAAYPSPLYSAARASKSSGAAGCDTACNATSNRSRSRDPTLGSSGTNTRSTAGGQPGSFTASIVSPWARTRPAAARARPAAATGSAAAARTAAERSPPAARRAGGGHAQCPSTTRRHHTGRRDAANAAL